MFFTGRDHTDRIFDAALFADAKSADAQLRHSIADEQQKLSDLKNCFRMRMNAHSAHQFQQSIRRYRNTSFTAFCQGHFKWAVIQSEQMVEYTESLVRQLREDRSLVVAILSELLCVITLAELP
jgi:hypothetical protein